MEDDPRVVAGAVYEATRCLTETELVEVAAPVRLGIVDAEGVNVGKGSLRLGIPSDVCEAGLRIGAARDICDGGRGIVGLAALRGTEVVVPDVCKDALLLDADSAGLVAGLGLPVIAEGCFATAIGFVGGGAFRAGGLLGFGNSFCGTPSAVGWGETLEVSIYAFIHKLELTFTDLAQRPIFEFIESAYWSHL